MKAKFTGILSLAALSLVLAACSSEEDEPRMSPPTDNAIRFVPRILTSSRTTDYTTSNLTSFQVYAYTGHATSPTLLMNNVTVSKGENNLWTYSPVVYWPNVPVSFYAFAPAAGWVNPEGPLSASPVYQNTYGMTDLIYALSNDQQPSTPGENAQVILNFRHALSKVSLSLRSTNPEIEVKVSNILVVNIMSKGKFTFPSASTVPSATPTENSIGSWSDLSDPTPYVFLLSQRPTDVITLTETPNTLATEDGSETARYLLPQMLSYRSMGMGSSDTFLTVMCSIYDKASGAQVWPNENTPEANRVPGSRNNDGLLRYPLDTADFSSWEPGHHYIYNLTINANPEMNPIEFGAPSVDAYVTVESNYN